MSRYFFNVYDGIDMMDDEGTELGSVKEMRIYMLTMASHILAETNSQKEKWQMEVLDERGEIVASMDFGIGSEHR